MPKSCSVGSCTNNSFNSSWSFYRFPDAVKHGQRRRLWSVRCRRLDEAGHLWEPKTTTRYVYVCGAHFITGKPSNVETHPDYAPSLNIELKSDQPNATKPTTEFSEVVSANVQSSTCTGDGQLSRPDCSLPTASAGDMCGPSRDHSYCVPDSFALRRNAEHSVPMELASTSEDCYLVSTAYAADTTTASLSTLAVPDEAQSYSLMDLKRSLSINIMIGGFMSVSSNRLPTFVTISNDKNPCVVKSVVINSDFTANIQILGRTLNRDHWFWEKLPDKFDTPYSVESLLKVLSTYEICKGVTEPCLVKLQSHGSSKIVQDVPNCNRIRCTQCDLLINTRNSCSQCIKLKNMLRMRLLRRSNQVTANDLTRIKSNNKILSSPLKLKKMRQLAWKARGFGKTIVKLNSQLAVHKRQSRQLINRKGEHLNELDSQSMLKLTRECDQVATAQFPSGSFQQIFWQQQVKYNALKNKASMKWHPSIIRWCLYIKSKSAKAFDGMRAYLSLPSERTLYDYSHYTEHGLGINPKTLEQLIVQAKKLECYSDDHKSYVGMLLDEVKIKSDLVYHKTSGHLIGYVKLDEVSNELMKLEHFTGREQQLAENLLVVMVRGLTTNLAYPLASYASKSLSAVQLYNIVWECIEYVEIVAGLKVLFICCDGAVQNRKFFSLHGSTSELSYKTPNPFASDEMDLFFVSDPPHLLKTARNCFANTKSRHLWFEQDIRWDFVVRLYNQHCVESEYRICPKLTSAHVNLTAFSKMRVSLAAQVMSSSVANALEFVYGDQAKSTVQFIRMINKWFDIVNVKNLYEGKHKRNEDLQPFTDINDPRLRWLERDFIDYLDRWADAAKNRSGKFTTQQRQFMQLSHQTIAGFKMTSCSIAEIVRILLASGANFVLTNHINQDPLEQLFGHCRHKGGSNNNPSVLEACHAINTIRTVKTQAVENYRGNITATGKHQLDLSSVPKRCSKRVKPED